jgi:hypothetical protein
VWGAAPASGEAWLRSTASAGELRERGERERERKLGEGERGRSSAFYKAREGEERAPGGEGRPAINGAISDTAAVREGEGREKREGSQWGPPVREREGRKVRAHGRLGPGGPK